MIEAEATVRHPLYPELGKGRVLRITRAVPPAALVEWSTGQTSTHAIRVLRLDLNDEPAGYQPAADGML